MNLSVTEITFLSVVISVKNGSVYAKKCREKWGKAQKNKTEKGNKGEKEDKYSKSNL